MSIGRSLFIRASGGRLDADISAGDDFRVVQMTPPQSLASIRFGRGLTTAEPGSLDRQPGHTGELDSRVPGPDLEHSGSYLNHASFNDPNGNGWLLQEIKGRFPGRVWEH